MYISLRWVQEVLGLNNLRLIDLSKKLTNGGFEVEQIIEKTRFNEKDYILDISLTANRSDLYNVNGLIHEISVLLLNKKTSFLKEVNNLYLIKPVYVYYTKYEQLYSVYHTIYGMKPLRPKYFFYEKSAEIYPSKKYRILYPNPPENYESIYSRSMNLEKFKPFIWEFVLQKEFFEKQVKKITKENLFQGCNLFFTFESKNCIMRTSPIWLQKDLLSCNIIPRNSIEDTINWVMLETGYPFFCCDLKKLQNYLHTSTIYFGIVEATEKHNKALRINEDLRIKKNIEGKRKNLLLLANEQPIASIGLFLLKDIEIDSSTTDILFYGGLFDRIKIRKSSRIVGFRTEYSNCLEKNLNINGLEQAYIRLLMLLKIQGLKNNLSKLPTPMIHHLGNFRAPAYINYLKNSRKSICLRYKRIKEIVGNSPFLTYEKVEEMLLSLNFQIVNKNEDNWFLYIPFSREDDIDKEIDIIEEIAKIVEFCNIRSILPPLRKFGSLSKLSKLKRILRKGLILRGLNEVINYTLVTKEAPLQIQLKNPLVIENNHLRTTLLKTLINKAIFNRNQQNNRFEAFEIGRVYTISKKKNTKETEVISGIFGGNRHSLDWIKQSKTNSWFEAKGFFEKIFSSLNISFRWVPFKEKVSYLHPTRSAELYFSSQFIGIFGQIHPAIVNSANLCHEIYLFELDLEKLESCWKPQKIVFYKEYSNYPFSLMDLAIIVPNHFSYLEIENSIKKIGKPILEEISLFDYYKGNSIPKGYHSLGFTLKFRHQKRTLKNEEVQTIIKKITDSLVTNFNAILRN